MLNVSQRSAAVVVLLATVVARGDGCSGDAPPGPVGLAQCSGETAVIGLVAGYCAAVPNCLDGLPYYDMTFSLEPKDGLPDWLEFRTARAELQDVDPMLPVDAFRVCATRPAMSSELTTVTTEIVARQPSRGREVVQKATVLLRSALPSVKITPRSDRTQFAHRSTQTATDAPAVLVATENARITFDVTTSFSEANGCEDLKWELGRPANSVATIVCDTSRPSEAVLQLDPSGAHDYQLWLTVTEPSGLEARSNVFHIETRPNDARPVIEIVRTEVPGFEPSDMTYKVPAYEHTDVFYECRRGYFSPPVQCGAVTCNATAPVLKDISDPLNNPPLTAQAPGWADGCRIVNMHGGQRVQLWVVGEVASEMTTSETVNLVAE
jgi:hypothetical protein